MDVPQLFWISLALYSFVALLKTYETKYYLLLGLFTALAIGTKDSAYALFLGIAPVLLYFHLHHETSNQKKWWIPISAQSIESCSMDFQLLS